MSGVAWAWLVWILTLPALLLLAFYTIGFTLAFIPLWWIGGPLHVTKDGDVAPFWQPMKPTRPWWRHIR